MVFHMGKVASTAICLSLGRVLYPHRHCQYLGRESCDFFAALNRMRPTLEFAQTIAQYNLMAACIQDPIQRRGMKVLSLSREPVSNLLSHFFHAFDFCFRPHIAEQYGNAETDAVVDYLQRQCAAFAGRHDMGLTDAVRSGLSYEDMLFHFMARNPLHWFDEEMKPAFGIDVYDTPIRDGILSDQNVLVIRYEDIPAKGEDLIRRYASCPEFQLQTANTGDERTSAELYRDVRSRLSLPEPYLNLAYTSKYARHFYSAAEIGSFRSRW
jgi:hypothetical protein